MGKSRQVKYILEDCTLSMAWWCQAQHLIWVVSALSSSLLYNDIWINLWTVAVFYGDHIYHGRSRQITANLGRSRQITAYHGISRHITTDHGRLRQITADHGKSQQITAYLPYHGITAWPVSRGLYNNSPSLLKIYAIFSRYVLLKIQWFVGPWITPRSDCSDEFSRSEK